MQVTDTASAGNGGEATAELDLARAGIGIVIWATGYRPDLSRVRLPILDAEGYPVQRHGVTAVPGLYILGLDWLHSARSGLFTGVGADAAYVGAQITGRNQVAPQVRRRHDQHQQRLGRGERDHGYRTRARIGATT
jgi:hypothetical protein